MSRSPNRSEQPAPEGVRPDDWQDLVARRDRQQGWWRRQEPRSVGDVVAQVVQRKGYAQLAAAHALEEAWREVAGDGLAEQTRPGNIRRGVLEILVTNNLLMQELGFQQQQLLADLQKCVPDAGVRQLRFRIG